MNKRPLSIQIIGIIYIVSCALYGLLIYGTNQPFFANEIILKYFAITKWTTVTVSALSVLLGFQLLFGKNWARWVMTIIFLFTIVGQFLSGKNFFDIFVSIAITSTMIFFLHTKKADQFFKPS